MKVSSLQAVMFIAACGKEPDVDVGEQVVNTDCMVCHGQAINSACLKGFELMLAKGGRTALSDEDAAAAVRYMINQVK